MPIIARQKRKFAHEIAIADGIDAILAYARKTEGARDAFAIENNGRSGERPGSERNNVCSCQAIAKPIRIPLKGPPSARASNAKK
jgi:hypothetical protein